MPTLHKMYFLNLSSLALIDTTKKIDAIAEHAI